MRKKIFEKKGFTLTEVLIGMMILTTAIVALSSIVINLMRMNRNIVDTQKAYYFAQEGIEAVLNMRDTNWLNNVDYLGRSDLLGVLSINQKYSLGLSSAAWRNSNKNIVQDLTLYKTWDLFKFTEENSKLCLYEENGSSFFALCGNAGGEDSGFRRYIEILPYCDDKEECEDMVLVKSTCEYGEDYKSGVELELLITNWRDGVF